MSKKTKLSPPEMAIISFLLNFHLIDLNHFSKKRMSKKDENLLKNLLDFEKQIEGLTKDNLLYLIEMLNFQTKAFLSLGWQPSLRVLKALNKRVSKMNKEDTIFCMACVEQWYSLVKHFSYLQKSLPEISIWAESVIKELKTDQTNTMSPV